MRHSQNTFINMFNINSKNDISFSIMFFKHLHLPGPEEAVSHVTGPIVQKSPEGPGKS